MEIFKLFGSIFIKDQEANKKLDDIDKKGKKTGDTLKKMGATAAKWGAGLAAGAAAAYGGMMKLAHDTAQATDRIDKLSQKIGMSRKGFQEWEFILSQSGADVEGLQMGFKTMSMRIDELSQETGQGAESFAKLGLKMEDIKGMNQEQVFELLVQKLQEMKDGTEKAVLANELFGKSGSELMPLLNGAAGSIDEMKAKAAELGLVIGDDAIDAGVRFTDLWDQAKRALGAAALQIGSDLFPVLENLLSWLIENTPMIKDTVSEAFDKMGKAIEWVKDNSNVLIPVLASLFASIAALSIINTVMGLMAAWRATTFAQTLAQQGLNVALKSNPIGLVITAIGLLVAAGVLLYQNWDVVKEKLSGLWQALSTTFTKLKIHVSNVWEGITDGLRNMVNKVIDGVNVIIRAMNKLPKVNISEIGHMQEDNSNKSQAAKRGLLQEYASGTDFAQGGLSLVGEKGAELVDLPRGSKVYTADETKQMLGGMNFERMFEGAVFHVRSDLDIKKIAEEFYNLTKSKSRGLGLR